MMNRNQKIALGCGVAGCLGLIVIVIVIVVLGVFGYVAIPGASNRNDRFSSENSNNSNANTEASPDTNSNSDSSSSSSSSSMSEDDKHKLFQAAGITQDSQLILQVLRKIGFPNGTGEGYKEFTDAHAAWALNNMSFIRSVLTPEKARAYVEAHIDD